MPVIPAQAFAAREESKLGGRLISARTHPLIAARTATAGLMGWRVAARAGDGQSRIATFPVLVALAAGHRLLGVGPAHGRPTAWSWNIRKVMTAHDARSISGF